MLLVVFWWFTNDLVVFRHPEMKNFECEYFGKTYYAHAIPFPAKFLHSHVNRWFLNCKLGKHLSSHSCFYSTVIQ